MTKKAGCLTLLGVFLFIVVIAAIIALAPEESKKPSSTTSSATIDLEASVRFDGSQFIITNQDSFDWTTVKLEVNSGLLTGGYVLKVKRLEAGHVYTVGALQFAKGDGTRLNPWKVKPQKFSIWCDVPRGKGFWYGEFN